MSGDLVKTNAALPVTIEGRALEAPATPRLPSLTSDLRTPLRWALIFVVLFFGIGGGWAATAKLAGAVIAQGVVSPESRRQTIQHLEGGIIRALRVVDGDRVQQGDILVVLQDVDARADTQSWKSRLVTFAATEARAEAERDRKDVIDFNHPALADRSDPMVRAAIEQETNRFEARKATDQQRKGIIAQRSAQLNEQIIGYEKQLRGTREQIQLLQQETTTVDEMVSKGYDRLPRLLALKRSLAQQGSLEGELMANVARAREGIAEQELQIANVEAQRIEQVETELSETRAKRQEVEEQIRKTSDRLDRTVIRAPVPGVVLNLRFKTTGGVVRPGEPILDIVPTDERLLIDARVNPKDIDEVHEGLSSYVIFPSYPQRRLHRISGKVTQVSADALQDEKTGERYFQAKIEVDRAHLHQAAPNIVLTPGLPAEVFIATVERTVLDYLMQPIEMAMERSFREN